MKHVPSGDPEKSRSRIAGIALVFASAAIPLSWEEDLPLWIEAAFVSGLFCLSGAFLLRAPWLRSRLRQLSSVLLSSWLHREQDKAREENLFYPGALERHRLLLGFSLHDLARETGIPLLALWLFSRFPGLIPRPEYLEALERALLLPEGYFAHGGSYGPDYSLRRLYRYDDLGYGRVFTLSRVRRTSQKERDEIVRKLEDLRWEELRKEGKVS